MATAAPNPPVRTVSGRLVPAAGTYVIDPPHSQVLYEIGHMTIGRSYGFFTKIAGEINVAEQVEQSSANINLEVASVFTSAEGRDKHVSSEAILNVEKNPTATFKSTKVEHQADGTWNITGDLSMLGVTKPLVLHASFGGGVIDPWGNPRIAFHAEADMDRLQWNVTWNTPLQGFGMMLADQVKLRIGVQATAKK